MIPANGWLWPWSSPQHGRALDRRGVAALEFALTAPLLLLLMGMYDLANGWIAMQRLTAATRSVGQIATLLAVNADGSNSLSHDQAWRASTAVYAAMPELLAAGSIHGVTMSEVVFTSGPDCAGTSCVANVAWSTLLLGTAPTRVCGTLTATDDAAKPDPALLPKKTFLQAAPLLVVDVTRTFTPMFLGVFTGSIPLASSAYLPVRSGTLDQTIRYEDPDPQCPLTPAVAAAANPTQATVDAEDKMKSAKASKGTD